jgi:hypothetical protein
MAIFPPNATLIFDNPTALSTMADGVPVVPSEPFLLVASVSLDSSQRRELMADADLFKVPLKGRAVTPKALPNTIKPGSQAKGIFWRVGGGFKVPVSFASISEYEQFVIDNEAQILVSGDFFIKVDLGSRFGVQNILGDRVDGHLVTEVAWEDPL